MSNKKPYLDKELIFNRLTNKLLAILILCFGIFFVFYSLFIQDQKDALLYHFRDTISTVGQILIAFSAGSLLLEWFGYVNYTRKRMCEILCDNEVLNVLTKERKQQLKSAILHNLYMPKEANSSNSLVEMFDKELDNIMKDYYYEEYISYIDISVVKNSIRKKIKQTITAKSINGETCHYARLLSVHELSDDAPVNLLSLTINNKKVKADLKKESELSTNNYVARYFIDMNNKKIKELCTFNDTLNIEIEYETKIDIHDRVYTHQIDRPCKHYCVHFNLNTKGYVLDLFGFGFMSLGNKDRKRIVKTENGYMLRFLNWILPGDGISAALIDKLDK